MNEAYLERLRREEITLVRQWFKPGMRVLELGGGNGFQARILATWGCEVTSLDLPDAAAAPWYYPVQAYDGQHIPFSDHSFDAVFSSNVLEHIPHLPAILREIARVAKDDGVIVHILPTSTWRFWTLLFHCARLVKLAGTRGRLASPHVAGTSSQTSAARWGLLCLAKQVLIGGPHGAYPSALSELYYFSQQRWLRVFEANGFAVMASRPNGLFYTGNVIFPSLPLQWRRMLARVLGSAARVYVMRKA